VERASLCSLNGIHPDFTSDLNDPLPGPTQEFRGRRDVRLDGIYMRFHFAVKTLLRSDRMRGMAEIAGTCIPIIPHLFDLSSAEDGFLSGHP
jgi:hypothetical protein